MARDEAIRSAAATPATSATKNDMRDGNNLNWERKKVAEDELSELWKNSARIETDSQFSEVVRLTQTDPFWPQIEKLALSCDAVLKENGFPSAAQMAHHDGIGNLLPAPKALAPNAKFQMKQSGLLAQEVAEDFSDLWYAGRLGVKCQLALAHFRKGDAGKPFLYAIVFEIATLRNDWQWRSNQKPNILTGQKQRKTLEAHRSKANTTKKEIARRRKDLVEQLCRQTITTGGSRVKYVKNELMKQGIFVGDRTIRRDIKELELKQ